MIKYSIYDKLNCFGETLDGSTASDNLYVGPGNNPYAYTERNKAEGGEIGVPYFAEFRLKADATTTKTTTLTVEGAPDTASQAADADKNAPPPPPADAAWVQVGGLAIPAGKAATGISYKVAFSDSVNKWFRVKVTPGAGETATLAFSAFLLRD
jgi:hypothetical protein